MRIQCAAKTCRNILDSYHNVKRYCSATCRYREKATRNRKTSPERHKHNNRIQRYKRNFGLSLTDYDSMLLAQKGRCAICRRLPGKNRLSVDHDHKTGAVRGLLCAPCNRMLGWYESYEVGIRPYLGTIDALDDYQLIALETAASGLEFPMQLAVLALGLGGESGEVCDSVKKILGHGHELNKEQLMLEVSDVLWYVATFSNLLGYRLSEVATANAKKLKARYPQGFSSERSINREATV